MLQPEPVWVASERKSPRSTERSVTGRGAASLHLAEEDAACGPVAGHAQDVAEEGEPPPPQDDHLGGLYAAVLEHVLMEDSALLC